MKKQKFQYGVSAIRQARHEEYGLSGYRWAPESFRVFKGLPGQNKKEIALTDEERREVGCRFLSGGFRAAIAHVKLIEQERDHE